MRDQLPVEAPAPKKRLAAEEVTAGLRLLLRSRYGEARRYAVLEEVADSTGYAASRSCDLVAFNLWPSDGLEWQGHEIKASRSDWLREIKDPDKADAFAIYCDRWWIVAGDKAMVQIGELREGWGLMVPGAKGLRVVVGAAKREPKQVPRRLVAAILRRSQESSPGERERLLLRDQLSRATGDAVQEQRRAERERDRLQGELDSLRKGLADFETASGIRVEGYSGKRLGEQVALLGRTQIPPYRISEYRRLATTAEGLAREAKEAADAAELFAGR